MEDQRLNGQVALVTGGGSGIGWAACKAFARAGARVVVSDINEENGNRVVKRLIECGHEAMFVGADVSNAADMKHLMNATVAAYGYLDMAFNNAGIEGELAPMADYSDAAWDRVIAVNVNDRRKSLHEVRDQADGEAEQRRDRQQRVNPGCRRLRERIRVHRSEARCARADEGGSAGVPPPTTSASTPSVPRSSKRRCCHELDSRPIPSNGMQSPACIR